mgnify:CR=1 FL=1
MAVQKHYAGAKLREIRQRLGLTQKAFAGQLGVSLPYLNQMENNHRPVSTTVVLALAREFGFDVAELAEGDAVGVGLLLDRPDLLHRPGSEGPEPFAPRRIPGRCMAKGPPLREETSRRPGARPGAPPRSGHWSHRCSSCVARASRSLPILRSPHRPPARDDSG